MSKRLKVKSPIKLLTVMIILILIITSVVVLIKSSKKSIETSQIEISNTENSQLENNVNEENNIDNEINTEQENIVNEVITNNEISQNETTNSTTTANNTVTNQTTNAMNNTTSNNTTNSTTTTNNTTKNNTIKTTDPKYYIKVNVEENVVNIYEQDENGEYTVLVKAMLCSTGKATPEAGEIFTMPNDKWNRYPWGTMVGGIYAQYYSRINGNILFHSVPYTAEKKNTLEYEEYDKLGTKASAGCIRLTVINAKWIYDNCPPGTMVEFYASSDPGPLGKPTEQKISDADSKLRCWDPTDPDKNNPWNK